MSDRETGPALLRTVREHPDEDAPRLIYADWLDENPALGARCPRCRGTGSYGWEDETDHGTPFWRTDPCRTCADPRVVETAGRARAELIRLQIERARRGLQGATGSDLVAGRDRACRACGALWRLLGEPAGWTMRSAFCGTACCDNVDPDLNCTPLGEDERDLLVREYALLNQHKTAWRTGPPCPVCRGNPTRYASGAPRGIACLNCAGSGDAGGLRDRQHSMGAAVCEPVFERGMMRTTVSRHDVCANVVRFGVVVETTPSRWLVRACEHHPDLVAAGVTGLRPADVGGKGPNPYAWIRNGTDPEIAAMPVDRYTVDSVLPGPLFDVLVRAAVRTGCGEPGATGAWATCLFPTETAAHRALAHAVVEWTHDWISAYPVDGNTGGRT